MAEITVVARSAGHEYTTKLEATGIKVNPREGVLSIYAGGETFVASFPISALESVIVEDFRKG
jgi:hypothetical protein